MAKTKNIYEERFEPVNQRNSNNDSRSQFLNNRVDDYFDNNFKDYKYMGKSKGREDYDIYQVPNRRKSFGSETYFVDKNPNVLRVGIYRVKSESQPYSPIKNSEPVYIGKLDESGKSYIGKGVYKKSKNGKN